jgi:hypothetical protein
VIDGRTECRAHSVKLGVTETIVQHVYHEDSGASHVPSEMSELYKVTSIKVGEQLIDNLCRDASAVCDSGFEKLSYGLLDSEHATLAVRYGEVCA